MSGPREKREGDGGQNRPKIPPDVERFEDLEPSAATEPKPTTQSLPESERLALARWALGGEGSEVKAFIIYSDRKAKWGQVFYKTLQDAWTRGVNKNSKDYCVVEVEVTEVRKHEHRPKDMEGLGYELLTEANET